jgi:hypothetical protein
MNQEIIRLGDLRTWEPPRVAPFHDFDSMIHLMDSLRKQNDDCLTLIDGLEGSGKSTIARRIVKRLQPDWDAETGLIIDYDDWEEVYSLDSGRVFILDEGGDLMFSRDALQRENKLVVRMFQMARIFNHIIIVCCPNIHWVDPYVRLHRALIYGHAHKTYHADGVRRGIVSWNWPSRFFDWNKSEWTTRWNVVCHSRFSAFDNKDPDWIDYEKLKRLKVQKRQQELSEALRR